MVIIIFHRDMLKSTAEDFVYSFDMPALLEHLRKQSEVNRVASYFNIDILKYQVSKMSTLILDFQ